MHWKQAQQSLRLHRIRLLINLVEGAHPPPQLPPPDSFLYSLTHPAAGARTRPPLSSLPGTCSDTDTDRRAHPSPRPPVSLTNVSLLLGLGVATTSSCARKAPPPRACVSGSAVLAERVSSQGGLAEPPANLLAAWPLHLFKQRVMGLQLEEGEGKTKWFIVPQDPPFWLSIFCPNLPPVIFPADSSTLPQQIASAASFSSHSPSPSTLVLLILEGAATAPHHKLPKAGLPFPLVLPASC